MTKNKNMNRFQFVGKHYASNVTLITNRPKCLHKNPRVNINSLLTWRYAMKLILKQTLDRS